MFNRKKIKELEEAIRLLRRDMEIQNKCYPTPARTISVKRRDVIPEQSWYNDMGFQGVTPKKIFEYLSLHEAVEALIRYFGLLYVDGKEEKLSARLVKKNDDKKRK